MQVYIAKEIKECDQLKRERESPQKERALDKENNKVKRKDSQFKELHNKTSY